MKPALILAAVLFAFGFASPATHAETINCTAIDVVPVTISAPGIYCFKQDLSTSQTTGSAITIAANNVIIDMNGFKLGGLGAGPNTQANGFYAFSRLNITIRNGTIRGFRNGVFLNASYGGPSSMGHIIEDLRVEGSRSTGIAIIAFNSIVRRNFVLSTSASGANEGAYGIYFYGSDWVNVEDNIIQDVRSAAGTKNGIYLNESDNAIIYRNRIQGMQEGTQNSNVYSFGIRLLTSAAAIIRDNMVSNLTGGHIGIDASGGMCVSNSVRGFATATVNCN